jgi:hypothetical protein
VRWCNGVCGGRERRGRWAIARGHRTRVLRLPLQILRLHKGARGAWVQQQRGVKCAVAEQKKGSAAAMAKRKACGGGRCRAEPKEEREAHLNNKRVKAGAQSCCVCMCLGVWRGGEGREGERQRGIEGVTGGVPTEAWEP